MGQAIGVGRDLPRLRFGRQVNAVARGPGIGGVEKAHQVFIAALNVFGQIWLEGHLVAVKALGHADEGDPGMGQRAHRQAFFGEVRHNLAIAQIELARELVLKLHQFRDIAVDGDFHRPGFRQLRDQAMGLHAGDAQTLCNLGLGQPACVMQPSRTHGEAVFRIPKAGCPCHRSSQSCGQVVGPVLSDLYFFASDVTSYRFAESVNGDVQLFIAPVCVAVASHAEGLFYYLFQIFRII